MKRMTIAVVLALGLALVPVVAQQIDNSDAPEIPFVRLPEAAFAAAAATAENLGSIPKRGFAGPASSQLAMESEFRTEGEIPPAKGGYREVLEHPPCYLTLCPCSRRQ